MANTFLATAAFGLEGVVAGELKRMGLPAKAENGGARFEGTFLDAFRANLHLRTADRVALLADGRLCMAGTPEQVYAGGALDRVFGVRVRRVPVDGGWQYFCE